METSEAQQHVFLSGTAVAVLFGVGSAIWALDLPEDGAAVSRVLAFYDETADRILLGGSLSVLGLGALVWFAAAVRQLLLERGGSDLLATTAFGGALMTTVGGIGAETINIGIALRSRDRQLDEQLARALFETSQALGSIGMGAGLGVFAVALAVAALRGDDVLPRAVTALLFAVGVLLLTPLSHVNWLPGAALVLIAAAASTACRPAGLRRGGALQEPQEKDEARGRTEARGGT